MKKVGIVLGAAALAAITGCKNPAYMKKHQSEEQNKATTVQTPPAKQPEVETANRETVKPDVTVEEKKGCQCAPGTKHPAPCGCGAADCKCVVEKAPEPKPVAPVQPEYTTYIVQRGDYLAKISKKYNITIAALRKANPSLKGDTIRIGQKLNLPGKVEVGEQTAPVVAPKAQNQKKGYVPYAGATKDYVVKSGDTLGAIAYGNGINIRQLKELNDLSGDMLRVGQTLKVPANGKPAAKAAPVAAKPAPVAKSVASAEPEKPVAAEVVAPVEETASVANYVAAPVVEAPAAEEAAPAEVSTMTYVVAEGDDMTSVSIQYGVSASAIRELNNLGDNDQLKPGQVIKLPVDAQ